MIAAGQGAVDGVRAEVLSKRTEEGSALQSSVAEVEMEGDSERYPDPLLAVRLNPPRL